MVKLQEKYGLFINGEFVSASGGKTLDTFDPATGKKLAAIADASKEDVDAAVKAAREAFKTFRHSTVSERSRILLKIADIIDANKDFLAAVETMDNGKPIRETLNVDVPYAAEHFRYFAGVIQGEEGSANVLEEKHLSLILREPIGVVAQIVPWNFPFLMAAWKLAPVIAAGDTSVLKPSSETSLSVLELMPHQRRAAKRRHKRNNGQRQRRGRVFTKTRRHRQDRIYRLDRDRTRDRYFGG